MIRLLCILAVQTLSNCYVVLVTCTLPYLTIELKTWFHFWLRGQDNVVERTDVHLWELQLLSKRWRLPVVRFNTRNKNKRVAECVSWQEETRAQMRQRNRALQLCQPGCFIPIHWLMKIRFVRMKQRKSKPTSVLKWDLPSYYWYPADFYWQLLLFLV
jgi:hypothetical protein